MTKHILETRRANMKTQFDSIDPSSLSLNIKIFKQKDRSLILIPTNTEL